LGKNYQKLPVLVILTAVNPRFKSDNGEIWQESAGLAGTPSSTPNFVKIA